MALSSPVLIGRDDLLALAVRRLRSAAAGRGELLLLAGEAGIGKTRLLREVVRLAAGSGFTVISAAAAPGDIEVAAGLLIDLGADLRDRIVRRLREGDEPGPPKRPAGRDCRRRSSVISTSARTVPPTPTGTR